MNWPDFANGCFEFFGACLICLNIKQLYRDKKLSGVHWMPQMFFTTWGLYNLGFYPYLGQYWSFLGACTIVLTNTIYISMMLYYGKQYEQCAKRCRGFFVR